MKRFIIVLIIMCVITFSIFANNLIFENNVQKFKVGDLVYICNDDSKDNTPLCISDYPSKIIAVRYFNYGGGYQYRVQVYYDKPIKNWNTKWWVIQKYIHNW